MGDRTAIEWTNSTWNPLRGTRGSWSCVKVSEGCAHCYAERFNRRLGGPAYTVGADELRLDEAILTQPLRWKRPRRVFVCSMTDLFEERVLDHWIDLMFAIMIRCQHHTFQVLTKRAEQMHQWAGRSEIFRKYWTVTATNHIWLGVSVENQERADERIPWLLRTPAAVRFLSVEPLLGPVDLMGTGRYLSHVGEAGIGWVIVGGESGGPPERALVETLREPYNGRESWRRRGWSPKPLAATWVRALRDQCGAAGVPFFFKQWGGPVPKSGGRLLDGKEWSEYP